MQGTRKAKAILRVSSKGQRDKYGWDIQEHKVTEKSTGMEKPIHEVFRFQEFAVH